MSYYSAEKAPPVISVTELNEAVKKTINAFFSQVKVEAEISSIRFHNTGNVYLTLKDDQSVVDCIIFRNLVTREVKALKEGDQILASGNLSVYVKGGRYSFNIRKIEPKGKGNLFEQFQRLKEKLESEGLFDAEFKKPIPFLPKKIGIVTSPDGAAVKDILKVTKRRFPAVDIIVFPAKVQGDDAAKTIISAIQAANVYAKLDVLIVGRGGGSYDDLFCFNDEALAHCIFTSEVPIVSAVGHERDFTIADFVADKRAATPSHAAELVLPDGANLKEALNQFEQRLHQNTENRLQYVKMTLEQYNPEYQSRLIYDRLEDSYRDLDELKDKMDQNQTSLIQDYENQLGLLYHSLEKLNPLYLLGKNYALVSHGAGKEVIGSIKDVEAGEKIKIRLKDGYLLSRVEDKICLNESESGRC